MADYESSFGAKPEGMWLPETAADTATLELLAANGIKFTVLAPHQCKRIRPLKPEDKEGDAPCTITPDATVDTTRPYLVRFASGASIAVFFYNGPVSRAIAFEGLLDSGDNLIARLKAGFKDGAQPQLAHVATDGESYGHHHRYGEMALAYALRLLEQDKSVKLTNYGRYLEQFPPEFECEIADNTSWSCMHGIERWRSNCGCNGGKPGWNQAWRGPLRQALDDLRDALVPLTEQETGKLFKDVWAARDGYIHVILDRNPESVDLFLRAHQTHSLGAEERIRALSLMEMQRNAQLMYTSCGWFFDDIGGIESVQVVAYAARVLQLAARLFGERAAALESAFSEHLEQAKSNDPAVGDGAAIYRQIVNTKKLHLEHVAAHYAISSVFTPFPDETELYIFRVRRISYDIHSSGRGRLGIGRARIDSNLTGYTGSFSFAVLHFGDQNITAAVKPYTESDAAAFDDFAAQAAEHVQRADFPEVIRLIDRVYGHADYSLTSLFTDEQRRIVQLILNSTLWDIENSLTTIYQDHASLLHYLSQAGLPKPPALTLAAGFAINAGLRRVLEIDPIDQAQMRSYLALAKADKVPLDTATLSYFADQRMKRAMLELLMSAGSLEILDRALVLSRTLTELPFDLNLWQAQNLWYEILRTPARALTALAAEERPQWDKDFNALGACLTIDTQAVRAGEEAAAASAD
jgi:hypothetical protein